MPYPFYRIPALLACLIGAVTVVLWLTQQNYLLAFNPNSILMVFNTAVCFTLGGAALLIPTRWAHTKDIVYTIIGLFLILLPGAVLFQDITGMDIGLDQLLVTVSVPDLNPHPGRLAPQTSLCFLLSGAALLLLRLKSKWVNIAIQAMALLVLALGMIGLAGAWIRLDLLYDWYKYSRMSVPTSASFVLLGSALWLKWYYDARPGYLHSEERRISVTGVALIVGVAFTAGMSVFSILLEETTHTLELSLTEAHNNQSHMVENEINVAIEGALPVTTRLLMINSLRAFNANHNEEARDTIMKDATSFLVHNFSALAIYSPQGELIANAGHFIENPELALPVHHDKYPVELLWDNSGAHLRITMDIAPDGEKIGSAVVERGLPNIGAMMLNENSLGQTAETGFCAAVGDMQMDCLPMRHRPHVATRIPQMTQDNIFPMHYALRGEKGVIVARDYRGHQVIAAYGQIAQTGLALVVKIDTAEFYAPIKRRLEYTLGIMIVLSMAAIGIQRAQLVPLVQKLVRSEQTARTSHQRLQASEEQFRSAMEHASIGMALMSPPGKWLRVNKALCRLLGYSAEELLTMDYQSITHPEDLAGDWPLMQQMLKREIQTYQRETRYFHKSGHSIWVLLSVSLVWRADDRPEYFIVQIQDISERKAMERMKSEFVSTVSHELRTPLTSIRGSLALVAGGKMGALPEKAASLIAIAHKNSERLVHIINDILDIEKIESGQFSMHIQPVEVAQLLRQAVEGNQGYGEKYRVRFLIKSTPPNATMLVDPDRFIQVMNNLLSNAAKFSRENGEIWISAEQRDGRVYFAVQDFGEGIPDAFHHKIFDKFAQADPSDTRRHEGTGLGLNITKRLVEGMYGGIRFETQQHAGTTFFVDFPAVAAAHGAADEHSRLGPVLLICEDDPNIAHLLQLLLAQAGFATEIAYSLDEARQAMQRMSFAALTLDLLLPDGNGLEFIRELRDHPATCGLPIVVISARANENDETVHGEVFGVVDWLSKPFDEARLLRAVQHAVTYNSVPKILHVEDDRDLSHFIAQALGDKAQLVTATTLAEAETRLRSAAFDLIMLDIALPDGNGLELLARLPTVSAKPIPVIILSASEIDEAALGRKVESILVKSRMSEARIIETIIALLPPPAKDSTA